MIGADHCLATRMGVADGRYTGEIEYYCYGEAKAEAAREHRRRAAATTSADCRAYSDSITDLPLLDAVGLPHGGQPRPGAAPGRRWSAAGRC